MPGSLNDKILRRRRMLWMHMNAQLLCNRLRRPWVQLVMDMAVFCRDNSVRLTTYAMPWRQPSPLSLLDCLACMPFYDSWLTHDNLCIYLCIINQYKLYIYKLFMSFQAHMPDALHQGQKEFLHFELNGSSISTNLMAWRHGILMTISQPCLWCLWTTSPIWPFLTNIYQYPHWGWAWIPVK